MTGSDVGRLRIGPLNSHALRPARSPVAFSSKGEAAVEIVISSAVTLP